MKRDSTMVNAFVPGNAKLTEHETVFVERRRKVLGPAYRLFYAGPWKSSAARASGSTMQKASPCSTSTTMLPRSVIAIRTWSPPWPTGRHALHQHALPQR